MLDKPPKTPKGYKWVKCNCICHRAKGIMHMVACCQNGYNLVKIDKPLIDYDI